MDDDTKIVGEHIIKKSPTFTKQDLEEQSWTPDKFVKDGQIVALPDDGKVDPNTQFIPDNRNSL